MSDQYLQMFVEEGREHIQNMNTFLLQLEEAPESSEPIQELFRSAHTLKGMAATMGFDSMAELTHELENVMQQLRDGEIPLTSERIDMFFRGVDRLEMMVEQAAAGEEMASIDDLVQNFRGGEEDPTDQPLENLTFDEYERSTIQASLRDGQQVYSVKVTVSEDCVLKGARAYMVYDLLESKGDVIKSVPTIEELEAEEFDRTFQFAVLTAEDGAVIQQGLERLSELESVTVSPLPENVLAPEKPGQAKTPTSNQSSSASAVSLVGKSIRVDIERLDALMNLFSEWVIDRGRLEQIASDLNHVDLTETCERMSRLGEEMQDTILNMRMVPVERVFSRFPRMIRDLAKELDKHVHFEMSGEETELDRTVIDEIGDPLVHLLRNALDHGLESPQERKKRGKPETGKLTLSAFYSGNHVFIEIADDGAGINREKVLQKAIANGVVDEETAKQMSDTAVYNLLFASGFSMADQVTDISGRGVGLDVVRSKIESLGGTVTVNSVEGEGTTFLIQLPLSLSILTALLVRLADETYAIPLSSILETGKFSKEEVHTVHGQPVIRFREHIVPLVFLHKVLELKQGPEDGEQFIVIVRQGEKLTGLVVDEFLGQQEIVLKSLGNYLNDVFAISGATILGNGQVALIIDTNALVKENEMKVASA